MPDQLCAVCGSIAEQVCARCLVARYCSRDHQKDHWKIHKAQCFPCRVEKDTLLGRYLVASKDISAGDVIISDLPLVVGPKHDALPSCLECAGTIDGTYLCKSCGYPLCGPSCEGKPNHRRECELVSMGQKKVVVNVIDKINPIYQCVTPLRCLWLKLRDKQKWSSICNMESHLDMRNTIGRCDEVKNFIVYFIRGYLHLNVFSEEEIQKVCGILETNGFEVPESNLVALFGFGCLLEHSCIPNTSKTFSPNLQLIVRASTDITAGEHIATSYIHPLWGQRIRKIHLMQYKFFACLCPRCVDPTDFGTHLSSVRCQVCQKGVLTPSKKEVWPWRCDNCNEKTDACEVEENLVSLFKQKENVLPKISSLEKYLKETRRSLSENHQYRLEIKLSLLQMYGRHKHNGMTEITDNELQRKLELCNEVLSVVNKLAPGLTIVRGLILFEQQATYCEKYRRLHKRIKNSEVGKELIQIAEKTVLEALQILRMETFLEKEREMVLEAEHDLEFIQETLKKGDDLPTQSNKQCNNQSNRQSNDRNNKQINKQFNKQSNDHNNKLSNNQSNRQSNDQSNRKSDDKSNKKCNNQSKTQNNKKSNDQNNKPSNKKSNKQNDDQNTNRSNNQTNKQSDKQRNKQNNDKNNEQSNNTQR